MIALRFSLSSNATRSGGRLNSMHPKITATSLYARYESLLARQALGEGQTSPFPFSVVRNS
jgi:hypothetical protein